MAVFNEGRKTFTANEALSQYELLKLSAASGTNVEQAEAGEGSSVIGNSEEDDVAIGEQITVRLDNAPGTRKVVAGSAFAIQAALFAVAAGRVDDVSSGDQVAVALEAATAAGDIVEVIWL